MVNLVEEVDLTEEHTSGISHTSRTAGDTAPSKDGGFREGVSCQGLGVNLSQLLSQGDQKYLYKRF